MSYSYWWPWEEHLGWSAGIRVQPERVEENRGLHSQELIPGRERTWLLCSLAFRCQPSWLPFIPKLAVSEWVRWVSEWSTLPSSCWGLGLSFPTELFFVLTSVCNLQWTWHLCQETVLVGSFPESKGSPHVPCFPLAHTSFEELTKWENEFFSLPCLSLVGLFLGTEYCIISGLNSLAMIY